MALPTTPIRRISRLSAALAVTLIATPGLALTPDPSETGRLKRCERDICGIIVSKDKSGGNLKCNLEKTWAKAALEKGGKSSRVTWLFGDARCKVDIDMPRGQIVQAMTHPSTTLFLAPHKVDCLVERSGKILPVEIALEPKLKFKNGRADKVWLRVKKVSGPGDIKSFVWTAAKLESAIGIFHKPMLRQINKFIAEKCPTVVKDKVKGKS